MEPVQQMALNRAQNALSVAIGEQHRDYQLKTFRRLREAVALGDQLETVRFASGDPEVLRQFEEKVLLFGDGVFADAPYAALSSAYLASLAPFSVFDALKQYALTLSPLFPQAIAAAGYSAGAVDEAAPKAVKQPSLQRILTPPKKVAAIVAWSDLIDRVPELPAMLARLADGALVRGMNSATFDLLLADSPTPTAGVVTSNARTDLETLVAALPAGRGLVVAAPWGTVRRLALAAERAPGFGVVGGEFAPGLHVVPTEDLPAGIGLLGVVADRVACADAGLQMRPGRHATIELAEDPTENPTAATVMTSLWQANLRGLLTERLFQLAVPEDAVAVLATA